MSESLQQKRKPSSSCLIKINVATKCWKQNGMLLFRFSPESIPFESGVTLLFLYHRTTTKHLFAMRYCRSIFVWNTLFSASLVCSTVLQVDCRIIRRIPEGQQVTAVEDLELFICPGKAPAPVSVSRRKQSNDQLSIFTVCVKQACAMLSEIR